MLWEDFTPTCFFKCSLIIAPDEKERLDKYATHVAGEDPAEYGYVKIEGGGNVSDENNTIAIPAKDKYELDFIYASVADAFINHPGAIDLRNGRIENFRVL